jgi:hypothetical protein
MCSFVWITLSDSLFNDAVSSWRRVMNDGLGCGRKWSWHISRNYARIRL